MFPRLQGSLNTTYCKRYEDFVCAFDEYSYSKTWREQAKRHALLGVKMGGKGGKGGEKGGGKGKKEREGKILISGFHPPSSRKFHL
jgi:hypothetical protein